MFVEQGKRTLLSLPLPLTRGTASACLSFLVTSGQYTACLYPKGAPALLGKCRLRAPVARPLPLGGLAPPSPTLPVQTASPGTLAVCTVSIYLLCLGHSQADILAQYARRPLAPEQGMASAGRLRQVRSAVLPCPTNECFLPDVRVHRPHPHKSVGLAENLANPTLKYK